MRTIPVVEAKSRFSGLLNAVESGEEVGITRYGRPVARLIPAPGKTAAEVLGGLWEQDFEFDVVPPEDPAPEPVGEFD